MPRTVSCITEQDVLKQEIAVFLAGRLALILLPVRSHLREAGLEDLVVAVQSGVQDIELNVSKILAQYEITRKKEE